MRLPITYQQTTFTDFQLYIAYLALKNHFTKDSYDFHKYQGKVGASLSSFEVRKDKYSFQKLARHRDPIGVMLSHFIKNPDVWIGSITTNLNNDETYTEWKKRQESLSYVFKEDLKKIGDIDDALYVEQNGQPLLLKMLLREQVSLETVCILQALLNFIPYWDKEMEKFSWNEHRTLIVKYAPFLEFEKAKMQTVLKTHQENSLH